MRWKEQVIEESGESLRAIEAEKEALIAGIREEG